MDVNTEGVKELTCASTEPQKGIIISNEHLLATLNAMGVTEYDPLVLSALSEYARRLATDLLSDAKDISVHAEKTEIDGSDMKLAIHLYDRKLVDSEILGLKAAEIAEEINKRPLPHIPDYAHRKIPGMGHSLLKRSYSYVPGSEAYPETLKKPAIAPDERSVAANTIMNIGSKRPPAKKIMTITAPRIKASVEMNKTLSI